MSQKAETKINHDKAVLCGNVHAVITLLYDPLCSFIAGKVNLFWQTTANVRQNEPNLKSLDFSQLLRYVKRNWSQKFAHCCSADLKKVSTTVIGIRNKISHQDFELINYQSYMEKLAKLANLINQSEIEQKIFALLKMGVIEADAYLGPQEKQWWQLKEEGNVCFNEERWTDAMNCYTKAIQQDSSQDVLFSNRALCELQLKKYQLAREDAEKAIGIDSTKIKYYHTLSEALQKLNLYQESFEICKNGLIVNPRDDTLLIRMRDCSAFVSKSENDLNNPRFWLKDGATHKDMLQKCWEQAPKLLRDWEKLTPRPEDVQYLSKSEHISHCRLCLKLSTAHKLLIDHKNDIKSEKKAFEIFEMAAQQNFAEGLYNAGVFYLHGNGCIARDFAKAKDLFLKAAEHKAFVKCDKFTRPNLGVAEAENALGNMFRTGNGEDKNENKAFLWYLKSAEHGCPEGQNNLAYFLQHGLGCKQDFVSARIWFERATEKNIAEAQCNLADMLVAGEGGPRDVQRAHKLYLSAGNQGMPGALAQLQQLSQSFALGPEINCTTQIVLQDCANSNDPHACLLQGMNYFKGEGGVAKEFVTAEMYLKKALELDNTDALLPLSSLLFEVKRNEEALKYTEQACQLGIKEAYLAFGKYCAYGHGCVRNEENAKKWLTRAKNLTNNEETENVIDMESILNGGKDVVEWEIDTNNISSGFTFTERINRCQSAILLNGANDCQIASKLISLFEIRPPPTMDGTLKPNLSEWITNMVKYAKHGSKSAHNFFNAMVKVDSARQLISDGLYFEAFQTIRLASRLWDLLLFDETVINGAYKALAENPCNSEALFFLATLHTGSLKEKIEKVHRCIEIKPTVSDYHYWLGCLYQFAECYTDALREINRALELDFCPHWLYVKATGLRFSIDYMGENTCYTTENELALKTIIAYETYLENNPPDDRKVPEAYFSIGSIYFFLKDYEKAAEYWEKGVEAEKLRLPCFEQVDDTFPPRQTLERFILITKKCGLPSVKLNALNKCGYCQDTVAKLRCSSCKRVWYCSKGCQTKHWKNHKPACKINK